MFFGLGRALGHDHPVVLVWLHLVGHALHDFQPIWDGIDRAVVVVVVVFILFLFDDIQPVIEFVEVVLMNKPVFLILAYIGGFLRFLGD